MPAASSLRGVWPAALTPFDDRLAIDVPRLVQHCRALLQAGCRGISLFGTTGEGTALSADERRAGLEAVIAAGIPADRLIPAVGCCDVPTTAALCTHAARQGVAGVLALPPFYPKDLREEGVYRHFASVIERLGAMPGLRVPRLCLYNFPFHTGVTLAPRLVRRLADAFPGVVVAVKDSSADWPLSSAYLDALPDLDVFVGDENSILKAIGKNGAGAISGMANIMAPTLISLVEGPRTKATGIDDIVHKAVQAMDGRPFIATMKAAVHALSGDAGWLAVRPPLDPSPVAVGGSVLGALQATGASLVAG
ncbi:MAG TPA: dihydrodipicolinate synthase family protein [Stellaceae bacterium]|nr:dihydrodipicolinate synthase family protein [Stellaceae bacterium]